MLTVHYQWVYWYYFIFLQYDLTEDRTCKLSHSKPKFYHLAIEEIYLNIYNNDIIIISYRLTYEQALSGRHESVCLIIK